VHVSQLSRTLHFSFVRYYYYDASALAEDGKVEKKKKKKNVTKRKKRWMKEIASYFDDDIDSCFFLLSVASIFKEQQQQHLCLCVYTQFCFEELFYENRKLATVRETLQSLRVSITVGYSRSPTN